MMKMKNAVAVGGWCAALLWAVTSMARDPFFPLGYEIKKPLPPVVSRPQDKEVKVIALPPPPSQKKREITSDDWDAARKQFQMTGFAVAGDRQVVLINGKSYRIGDKVSVTNQHVVFTWRIEIPAERKLNLVPVEAMRL